MIIETAPYRNIALTSFKDHTKSQTINSTTRAPFVSSKKKPKTTADVSIYRAWHLAHCFTPNPKSNRSIKTTLASHTVRPPLSRIASPHPIPPPLLHHQRLQKIAARPMRTFATRLDDTVPLQITHVPQSTYPSMRVPTLPSSTRSTRLSTGAVPAVYSTFSTTWRR